MVVVVPGTNNEKELGKKATMRKNWEKRLLCVYVLCRLLGKQLMMYMLTIILKALVNNLNITIFY